LLAALACPPRPDQTSEPIIYGFVHNGSLYLNGDYLNANTPIHEFGHLWNKWAKANRPDLYREGMNKVRTSPYFARVMASPFYQQQADRLGLTGQARMDFFADEALAMAIGDQGEAFVNAATKEGFMGWLKRLWDTIKSYVGLEDMTPEEVSTLSLEDFARGVAARLLEGRALSEGDGAAAAETAMDEALAFAAPEEVTYDGAGNPTGVRPDVGEAMAAERQQIEEQAKSNGTWLKAPNGQPTKLTPAQWVTVRTRRFKEWFGDWIKWAQIEKLKRADSVVITGTEITTDRNWVSARITIVDWAKKNLRGTYLNKDTSERIGLYKGGIEETARHGNAISHLQSIAAIPQMIENSIFIEQLPNENSTKPEIKHYRYFVTGIRIDGVDYTAKLAVAVDKDGNRFYDHDLTEIEKGRLIGGLSAPVTQSALSEIKDKRLLSILQTTPVSQVVDENGEPLVVYHGTNKLSFGDSFKRFDTYNSNHGLMGKGSYFTADPSIASEYTNKGQGENPSIYPVFLSIKHPLNMDAQADESKWTERFPDAADYHNGKLTNESWLRAVEDSLRDQGISRWEGADEIQSGILSMGYDGVTHVGGGRINKNGVQHQVFIAYEPFQIKSATGNAGTFSGATADIRYQNPPPLSPAESLMQTAPDLFNRKQKSAGRRTGPAGDVPAPLGWVPSGGASAERRPPASHCSVSRTPG